MKYYHFDVFTQEPYSGNGLTVVFPDSDLDASEMQNITREFRQFETIFIFPEENGIRPVRIFTMEEELPFAGHPLVGAAAAVHILDHSASSFVSVRFGVGTRIIELTSRRESNLFSVVMNQGAAEFTGSFSVDDAADIIDALNLAASDIHEGYPVEVVSTGLPYLLLPLKSGLGEARIRARDFETMLTKRGAKFIYVFEPREDGTYECRTWDNLGHVEDAATGSAAGPLCAYLVKKGFRKRDEIININQGRFAGRPSLIAGWLASGSDDVFLCGDVSLFAQGEIWR